MVVENEELPAWLVELRQQQFADQAEGQLTAAEDRGKTTDQGGMAEAPRTQMAQPEQRTVRPIQPAQPEPETPPDVLGDLREQMLLAEEELDYREERASSAFTKSIMALKPAQRLLLSILLFLNVALCGCMALIMAGRVQLPF